MVCARGHYKVIQSFCYLCIYGHGNISNRKTSSGALPSRWGADPYARKLPSGPQALVDGILLPQLDKRHVADMGADFL